MIGNSPPMPCLAPTGATRTRYGERPLYEEGLYDLEGGVYAWLTPNGSWGESNSGLIVGKDQSLLLDTQWDLRYTRAMLAAMQPLVAQAPIRTIVNTHADGDHYFGNQLVEAAEIVTSTASRAEMARHVPAAMLMFGRLGRILRMLPVASLRQAGHYFATMCRPYAFAEVTATPATRTFDGELQLDRGTRKVRLIEVGPAHTNGDLIVHVEDSGVIFTGDILFVGSTPTLWAGPLRNWFAALNLIEVIDARVIVPGHGPLTDGKGVRRVRAYWEFVADRASAAYEAGKPAEVCARETAFDPEFEHQGFAAWNAPERIMTNCHVLYREYAGKTGPLSVLDTLMILGKQAQLANAMPKASPAIMRLAS